MRCAEREIKLTLPDISALIHLLGHAGAEQDAVLLRDNLKENIPAIVKLLACATGVQPLEMRDDRETEIKKPGPRIVTPRKKVAVKRRLT